MGTVRETLAGVAERFSAFEAEALNVPVDFPLFQRLALPIISAHSRIPGNHHTRMVRLMRASRSHPQRLAHRPDPPEGARYFRPGLRDLHLDPGVALRKTGLLHRVGRSYRTAYPQGKPRLPSLCPVPPAPPGPSLFHRTPRFRPRSRRPTARLTNPFNGSSLTAACYSCCFKKKQIERPTPLQGRRLPAAHPVRPLRTKIHRPTPTHSHASRQM